MLVIFSMLCISYMHCYITLHCFNFVYIAICLLMKLLTVLIAKGGQH